MIEQKTNKDRINDKRIIALAITSGILIAGLVIFQMFRQKRKAAEKSATIMRAFDSVNTALQQSLDSFKAANEKAYSTSDGALESVNTNDSTAGR